MIGSVRIGLIATFVVASIVVVWAAQSLFVPAPSESGSNGGLRSESGSERTATTRALRVSGSVLDPDDAAPVAGVVVRLDAGFAPQRNEAVTDDSGRFTFEVETSASANTWPESRRARIRVLEPGWISTVEELTLRQIESGIEPMVLAAPLCGIRIHVRDPWGNPVPGARAQVTAPSKAIAGGENGGPILDPILESDHSCGFDGRETRAVRYAMPVKAEGVVAVRGTRWMEPRTLRVWLPDGREYVQYLPHATRCGEQIDVDVVVPEIGATVEGVLRRGDVRMSGIVGWEWDCWGSRSRARGDGEFELRDVPPGLVRLVAFFSPREESVAVDLDVTPSGTIVRDLTVPVE